MNKILCLACLFCLHQICFSQSDRYLEGYIINTGGDTLRGYIKNIGDHLRSTYVAFKPSHSGAEVIYHGEDVRKYAIGNSIYYESRPVNILGEGIYRRLFLRLLVDGNISLYRLDYEVRVDEPPFLQYISTFYFYQVQGRDTLQELREQSAEYEYRSTLANEFGKSCLIDESKSTTFDDEGLTNLIIAYNSCRGYSFRSLITPEKQRNWRFSVRAGIVQSKIYPNWPEFDEATTDSKPGYQFGITLAFPINRNFAGLGGLAILHREAFYNREHVVTEFYDNAGELLVLESGINLNQLVVPLAIKYHFSAGGFTPFVALGGYAGIAIHNSSYVDKVSFRHLNGENLQYAYREEDPIEGLKQFEIGWKVGAGVEYQLSQRRAVSIEVQGTGGRNDAPENHPRHIATQTIGILLGFDL